MIKKLLFLFFAFSTKFLLSQEIITDRPDQTESAAVVGKNIYQIESGALNEIDDKGKKTFSMPTNLFRYGVSEKVELRLGLQHVDEKNYGIGSFEIGSKINLNKNKNSKTQIALLSHFILPKKEESLGLMNLMSLSHEPIKRLSVGYNLGYTHFFGEYGFLKYSVACGTSLSERLGLFVETYGEIERSKKPESNFDSGFTYLVKDNFQIDISFGIGINNKMKFQSIGVSWKSKKNETQVKNSL